MAALFKIDRSIPLIEFGPLPRRAPSRPVPRRVARRPPLAQRGLGYEAIRGGHADAVIVGGVDPLSEFPFAGFNAMQNVARRPCSPFSVNEGLTLGEGAGCLILERADRAAARDARVYGEILGCALNADAYHPTAPDPSGHAHRRLVEAALGAAGLSPGDIDHGNAHGTGTATNDRVESRTLALLLGDRARAVPVMSLKGAIGHTLGGAGALELAATVLAVHHDLVPPTANFEAPRPGCALDYVPGRGRPRRVNVALSENFAFGGNNAAVVVVGKAAPDADPFRDAPAREVVVTGIGCVSPIGIGRDAFLAGLRSGRGGVREADYRGILGNPVRLAGARSPSSTRRA